MFRNLFPSGSKYILNVDIHSHLIPGIDDGVKTIEESMEIIRVMESLGIQKIVTTPHIAHDFYPNSENDIIQRLNELKKHLEKEGITVSVEAAAEYYVDSKFLERVKKKESLLSFGDSFVLIETPFLNKPAFFEEAVFELTSNGYKPVLAHPERYEYLFDNFELLEKLKVMGLFYQVTAKSFIGDYSPEVKKQVWKIFNHGLVDFIGSDIHNKRHLDSYIKFRKSRYYAKLVKPELLNYCL